jgi:hypothetical protein
VAAKTVFPPVGVVFVAGLTLTDERLGCIEIMAELDTVLPLNVALTNSARVPIVLFAWKTTG